MQITPTPLNVHLCPPLRCPIPCPFLLPIQAPGVLGLSAEAPGGPLWRESHTEPWSLQVQGGQLPQEEGEDEGRGAAGAGKEEGGPLLSPPPHLRHGNRPPESQKTAQAEPHDPPQVGSPVSPLDLGAPALRRQLRHHSDLLACSGETGHEGSSTLASGESTASGWSLEPAPPPWHQPLSPRPLFRVNLTASHSDAPLLPSACSLSSEHATLRLPLPGQSSPKQTDKPPVFRCLRHGFAT